MATNGNGSTTTYQPRPTAIVAQAPQSVPLATTGETASAVLAAQAKALVSARFEIALAKPRDVDSVREKLLKECKRPSFAAVAIYHKPVGKGLEGPSIRFAEACLQAMGNLAIETPAIYDDAEKRILRVTVSDMETNVTHSKDVTIMKRVERSSLKDGQSAIRTRTNSYGKPVFVVEATDDEILNQENALVSKALRTTGLRLVPGWLIDECMELVRTTRNSEAAADPDAALRKLYDAFGALGVTVDSLKQWLGHDGAPQPKELEELRGIYTAIKDGEANWRDVMDAKAPDDAPARAAAASAAPAPTKGAAAVKAAMRKAAPAAAQPELPTAGSARPAAPADDVQFESAEEERARLEKEAKQRAADLAQAAAANAREPGSDDGDEPKEDDEFAAK
jgi:hypothetical protein